MTTTRELSPTLSDFQTENHFGTLAQSPHTGNWSWELFSFATEKMVACGMQPTRGEALAAAEHAARLQTLLAQMSPAEQSAYLEYHA